MWMLLNIYKFNLQKWMEQEGFREGGKSKEASVLELIPGRRGTVSRVIPTKNQAATAAAAMSHQSCPTLYDPIDCSPPGSSIHGIFQARVLEWLAIAFSRRKERVGQIEKVAAAALTYVHYHI